MASTQQIKRAARRRQHRTRLVLGVTGTLVVVLVVSLVLGAIDGSGGSQQSSSPSSPPLQSGGPIGPQGEVTQLPGPGELLTGTFPVRFPRTPEGAVAAMAAMLSSSWTLDVEQARRAAEIYAQPRLRQAAAAAAPQGTRQFREQIGAPPGGPAPSGAYLVVRPIAARWQTVAADRVRVAMLVEVTGGAAPQAEASMKQMTMGADWVWDPQVRGGDWVWLDDDVDSFVPPIADPGTAKFTSVGWRVVRP